jgi:hypothetical protein
MIKGAKSSDRCALGTGPCVEDKAADDEADVLRGAAAG